MARSSWKGPFIDRGLLKKKEDKRIKKVWSRRSDIVPSMIGITYAVHDGKKFENVTIKPEMVGHKLGEFVKTRKFIAHANSKVKVATKVKWNKK